MSGSVPMVGDLTPTGRVTVGDLSIAAEWLRAYETSDDDEADVTSTAHALARVAAYLEREAERRSAEATVRAVIPAAAQKLGLPESDPRVKAAAVDAVRRTRAKMRA